MIDFNEILVFIKVVEAGSFSAAAKLLGIPRSTVSRKVSNLENSLAIRLLNRSTRKLGLTGLGQVYYEKCRHGFAEIEKANQALTDTQTTPSGTLRISAPLSAQSGFLCQWVNEFFIKYSDVNGEILLSDDNVDMIVEGIDVAFRSGVLDESSLIARKLGSTKLVLCASDKYLNSVPPLDSIHCLKDHRCIVFGKSKGDLFWHLQNENSSTIVPIQARVIVNAMEYAMNACRAGLGIALLPSALVSRQLHLNELTNIFDNYSAEVGGFYIVYPNKTNLSITVREFINFMIQKSISDLPWKG